MQSSLDPNAPSRDEGKPREVTGRVYPAGPNSGKIKVRIHVDDLELIFNGTYTLSTQPAPR